MKPLLAILGGAAMGLAAPIWTLYAVYSLFALSLPFWSTVGVSALGFMLQVIGGAMLMALSVFGK
jgi:hypothetical protein